ncbi:prepilin-type N-terminal cleavage/methylation domain-containing protein [Candidatus Daviesbacteria bacterium]|nr:prepilin-type N-terminal cleavage/methylation domain-containing protein [Candidatus Daviesbacteria bacterium]
MNHERGQSLLEVIIAMTVGILVVTALVFATIFSLRNAQFAKNSAQATKLAQEGIERVRSGRDKNVQINLVSTTDCPTSGNAVNSWDGSDSGSPIWNCKIHDSYGSGGNAYFKFIFTSLNLEFVDTNADFPSAPEEIPQSIFKRIIILSDDASTYSTEKKVTVLVRWTDFAGPHESRLTTILRKL